MSTAFILFRFETNKVHCIIDGMVIQWTDSKKFWVHIRCKTFSALISWDYIRKVPEDVAFNR